MALLYPWATKEYLLWDMSLAQIVLYHNVGCDIKYPSPDKPKYTYDQIKAAKEEFKRLYGDIEE